MLAPEHHHYHHHHHYLHHAPSMSALPIIETQKFPNLSDCSPANRERELGSDRRESCYFYPVDEVDIASVIEASTRGTHRSEDDDDE